MPTFLRLLTLSLLLILTPPAGAADKISKEDLDAQKELLQLKIESGRDLVQKDLDSFRARADAFEKRIDDQNNRVSDIGQSVDRFSIIVSIGGLLMTVLLAFGGLIGYFSVAKKAEEEAKSASKKWFEDNHKNLTNRIIELEKAADHAHKKIDHSVNSVEQRSNEAIERMQKNMNAPDKDSQPISSSDQEALRQSVEQIKGKPEASYSFDDWNKRAFDAYRAGQHEDAALYWKRACTIPNAGASKTAQALFNRAATLQELNRHNEALTACEELIATYSTDATPAIREQVAKAMSNMAIALGKLQRPDDELATYEKLIAAYSADATPAIREQVAKAMNNMAIALGQGQRFDEAIAMCKQVIATYSADATPAIREPVAKAMLILALILKEIQKPDEQLATYEKLIATYSADATPAMREYVANAFNGKGFARLMNAKEAWGDSTHAIGLLSQAKTDLLASIGLNSNGGMPLGNLAYVNCLLGEQQEAGANFRAALRSAEDGGERLYKATLDDIAQHPIPEDRVFHELVECLWSEYQTEKSASKAS